MGSLFGSLGGSVTSGSSRRLLKASKELFKRLGKGATKPDYGGYFKGAHIDYSDTPYNRLSSPGGFHINFTGDSKDTLKFVGGDENNPVGGGIGAGRPRGGLNGVPGLIHKQLE